MDTDWTLLVTHPSGLILGFIAIVGACIGSFLTLVTYRLPREEKIGLSRSRCPSCGTTLGPRDLFPILSWLASRGRCRHCKTKVHYRYPLTELACALGPAILAMRYGLTLEALALAGLWWGMIAIIVTDLEHYIILDEVQIALALFGALYIYATGADWQDAMLAAIIGGLFGLALKYGFIYLRNKDGLGLGDVKFLAVAGLWLGHATNFVPFLFFAGVLGVIFGTTWRTLGRGEHFPFGPALVMALFLVVTFPQITSCFWNFYRLWLLGSSG